MTKKLAPHTLVIQHSEQYFLLYQPLLRKGVLLDTATMMWLSQQLGGQEASSGPLRAQDISCFSLSECLLDNPAGIRIPEEVSLEEFSDEGLTGLLQKHALVAPDQGYIERMGKKQSMFDRHRVGNFHQQIGEAVFKTRHDPELWWIDQKFESTYADGPRNTAYRWVQQDFMNQFFDEDLSGQRWLDFGCGIGYYTCMFSQKGADVVGVDPSEAYIKLAREQFSNNAKVEYHQKSFEKLEDFSFFASMKFDRIFMSDVFLYYFAPYKPLEVSAAELMRQMRKMLSDEGRIYILDPHGCFHLQAWMGEAAPFLVSTEYNHRRYRVTPTLEEASRTFEEAGLMIRRIRELSYQRSEEPNQQAQFVAREFPLWWCFELCPVDGTSA